MQFALVFALRQPHFARPLASLAALCPAPLRRLVRCAHSLIAHARPSAEAPERRPWCISGERRVVIDANFTGLVRVSRSDDESSWSYRGCGRSLCTRVRGDAPQAREQAPAQPPPAQPPARPLPPRRLPARRRSRAVAADAVAAVATRWSRSTPSAVPPATAPRRAAGRAPNLFDDQWVRAKDDEGIARVIADGVPQTEMIPFKEQLTDQQIWQLVAYLQTAGANAKPRPTFVADRGRPGDQDREADLQDRSRRARRRDAVGPGVPARRPPARHRARRQAENHSEGQGGRRRDRHRHAEAVGTPGRRVPRRRGASAVREERLDLPGVFRAGPELHAAASAAGRLRRRRPRDAAVEARRRPASRR